MKTFGIALCDERLEILTSKTNCAAMLEFNSLVHFLVRFLFFRQTGGIAFYASARQQRPLQPAKSETCVYRVWPHR
jgi:hypothetical protein